MNRSRHYKTLLLLLILVELSEGSYGQSENLLVPSDLKQQTIVTEPVTLRKGFFRAGTQLSYRVVDRRFDDTKHKEYFRQVSSGSSFAMNFTLQYGLGSRLELGFLAEYQNNRIENSAVTTSTDSQTTTGESDLFKKIGVGDIHFTTRYQLIGEERNKVSVTCLLDAIIPAGEKDPERLYNAKQYDLPVGDGSMAMLGGLIARTIIYPYSFTAFISYTRNFNNGSGEGSGNKGNWFGNKFETGLTTNLHLNEWIVFTNEFSYYHEGEGEINDPVKYKLPPSWGLTYEPKLYFQVKRFRLAESVTIPVKGRNVPADPLFIMLIQYVF